MTLTFSCTSPSNCYTGDYTGVTPIENGDISGNSNEARPTTIEAVWNGGSSERPSLFPISGTTQSAYAFGSTAPSEVSENDDKAKPFQIDLLSSIVRKSRSREGQRP